MAESRKRNRAIAIDDPNIEAGVIRYKRTLRVWSALAAGMGLVSYLAIGGSYPLSAAAWFTTAVLLLTGSQPALLALVSVQWGLSIIHLIPGVAAYLGPDPLTFLLDPGVFETTVIVVVRALLMVTSFNQFLFYRILYGTGQMSGLDEELADVPEIIRNRSDLLARISRALGAFAVLGALTAGAAASSGLSATALNLAIILGMYAVGLGVGAAFSPTTRRAASLTGIGLGALAFLMALILIRML